MEQGGQRGRAGRDTDLPSGALLENIDAETAGMTNAEAARLAAWLGPTRIMWPFPPT
jgi:hypothetical protein